MTTHANGFQQSAKENFGLVMRSVTNVMVFDTVIPPGYSIGLYSVIGLIVIVIGLIPR